MVVRLPSKNLAMRIAKLEAYRKFITYSIQEARAYAAGIPQSPMERPKGPSVGRRGNIGGVEKPWPAGAFVTSHNGTNMQYHF